MFNDGLFDDEFKQPLPKVAAKLPQNYAKDLQALPEKIKNTTFAKLKYIQWLEANIQGGWTQEGTAKEQPTDSWDDFISDLDGF